VTHRFPTFPDVVTRWISSTSFRDGVEPLI
jgi:hypothetical protein